MEIRPFSTFLDPQLYVRLTVLARRYRTCQVELSRNRECLEALPKIVETKKRRPYPTGATALVREALRIPNKPIDFVKDKEQLETDLYNRRWELNTNITKMLDERDGIHWAFAYHVAYRDVPVSHIVFLAIPSDIVLTTRPLDLRQELYNCRPVQEWREWCAERDIQTYSRPTDLCLLCQDRGHEDIPDHFHGDFMTASWRTGERILHYGVGIGYGATALPLLVPDAHLIEMKLRWSDEL